MVPWPIALLALYYGVIAATSAATVWKICAGVMSRSMTWPILWFVVAAGAMFGLTWLKPWGRVLAIVGATWTTVTTLCLAALFIKAGRPGGALLTTLSMTVQVLIIRYLQRPSVKSFFA